MIPFSLFPAYVTLSNTLHFTLRKRRSVRNRLRLPRTIRMSGDVATVVISSALIPHSATGIDSRPAVTASGLYMAALRLGAFSVATRGIFAPYSQNNSCGCWRPLRHIMTLVQDLLDRFSYIKQNKRLIFTHSVSISWNLNSVLQLNINVWVVKRR